MRQNEDISRSVRSLCERYGTRDPFRLAEAMGIHILYTDALKRLKGMYRVIKRNRFIILNELFTTAATYDAFVMGQRVIRHFADQGCLGVYVTHIAELSKAGDDVASLVALADEKDHKKRTFRIARQDAEGVGYAGDIVDKHHLSYEELCKRLDEGGLTK